MTRYLKFILLLLAAIAGRYPVFAQKVDTINVGSVSGSLKDSVHNYVLSSATITIYKIKGDDLVSYQLTNNYGKFLFKKIPVGIPLRAVAIREGYSPSNKEFIISPKTKEIDLATMVLNKLDIALKEITIHAAPPPVQMHGDTLEFNAAAFKLDTNAVVEDLLRNLPGVTVWSDGLITVNGKEVKSLLVEGKQFFGGDAKIALQNIPKNAVQKIQVYEKRDKSDTPKDPETEMNVVLKKDKKDGFFGKLGYGEGTDKRYAGDGSISYFSPKTQLSVVGATNNINKSAYSANTLIAFDSYKGEGINNTYYSDFSREGLNVFKALGFSAQHNPDKDSQLTTDYLLTDGAQNVTRQNKTLVSSGTDNQLLQTDNNITKNNNYGQRATAGYIQHFKNSDIEAHYNFTENNTSGVNNREQTSADNLTQTFSRNTSQDDNSNKQTTNSGELKLNLRRYLDENASKFHSVNMDMDYQFEQNRNNGDKTTITNYQGADTSQNKYINRHYLTNGQNTRHTLTTGLNNLNDYINLPYVTIALQNSVTFYNDNETANVADLAAGSSLYTPNTTLTNITRYQTIDERPGLNFGKNFGHYLANRFSKQWTINVIAQDQFYIQQNISQKAFQNLDRKYAYFTPSATIKYQNSQWGDYTSTYNLVYNTSVNYPGIWQMAPLNDDADVYNLTIGNSALKPAYVHDLSLNYEYYNTNAAKKSLNINAKLNAGTIEHFIADSVYYDLTGRAVHHFINVSGYQYANLRASFRTGYKLQNHQFQLTGTGNVGYSRTPSYVNGQSYLSKITSVNFSPDLNYTYKGNLAVDVVEWYASQKTDQGDIAGYDFHQWQTGVGAAYAFPKGFFINTRVNYRISQASQASSIHYTIWNADAGYRFLKGANAEIKLSAMDILHQNKNVYNYVGSNSVTTGTVNGIQQYFMLTLAYYPRKFGIRKVK